MIELTHTWIKLDKRFQPQAQDILRYALGDEVIHYSVVGPSSLAGFLELRKINGWDEEEVTLEEHATNRAFWKLLEDAYELLVPVETSTGWPENKEEAIALLQSIVKESSAQTKPANFEDFMVNNIHLGQFIRNNFGMWLNNEALYKDYGVTPGEADQLSDLVLKSFYEASKKNE
mgnify:CR=1 FL=1